MRNRVAVCVCAYNEERHLPETIKSVLAQKYNDFDLIISNNHSTDSTAEIIRDFQSKDKRIISWKPERFCKSIEHGRYVIDRLRDFDYTSSVFIGAHDLISNRYIEALCSAYQANPGAAVVVGSGFEIDAEGAILGEWPPVVQLKGGIVNIRPWVILQTLTYNLTAFGLWPNKIREAVRIRHECVANDHLYTAEASLHGDIIVEPSAVIYTRRTDGAGDWGTYFRKHISDDMRPEIIVADFEKQIEWVRHINDLAFARYPEAVKNINLACAVGAYFTRYGVGSMRMVNGALEMWLNSDSGRNIASQLNAIGRQVRMP